MGLLCLLVASAWAGASDGGVLHIHVGESSFRTGALDTGAVPKVVHKPSPRGIQAPEPFMRPGWDAADRALFELRLAQLPLAEVARLYPSIPPETLRKLRAR